MFTPLEMTLLSLVVVLFCFLFYLMNRKKFRRKKSREADSFDMKRKSDQGTLSAEQALQLKEAERLIEAGKIARGAAILESMGMHRQAITALERGGLIDEACQVLVRMNRPNRAGVVALRNHLPKKAAHYFVLADLPEEAAKALYEAGASDSKYYLEAATLFLNCGRVDRALDSYASARATLELVNLVRDHQAWLYLRNYMEDEERIFACFGVFAPKEIETFICSLPMEAETVSKLSLWCDTLRSMELIDLSLRRLSKLESTNQFWSQISSPLRVQVVDVLATAPRYKNAAAQKFLLKQARSLFLLEKYLLAAKLYSSLNVPMMAAKCHARLGNLEACLNFIKASGDEVLFKEVGKILHGEKPRHLEEATPEGKKEVWSQECVRAVNRALEVITPDQAEHQFESPFHLTA